VSTTDKDDNITDKIKHALHHSDVLLALPDSNIYNSKTVKNILLTSYRYRKPVIGFSKNFVDAGALAAIYSDTEMIAMTASKLIEQYLIFSDTHRTD
jgi:putative ABC transport system substrate-binding protein